ncbi:MAG: hypothetical protein JWR37_3684 [Mycobacterium sp.]|nr:hypothetical protein [Mycobacterium sp.]
MRRVGWSLLVLISLVTVLVTGCVTTSDGVVVRASGTSSAAPRSSATSSPTPSSPPDSPVAGVNPTSREPIPPNALPCLPAPADSGTADQAQIADPAAPRLMVNVPNDWTATPGHGDVALNLAGPDGMSGAITIATTTLGPAEAFTKFADDAMDQAPISTLSVLPAEFCGYSSQRLMDTWADTPDQTVEYFDRLTHIWTNTRDYLVTIHAQAPAEANGFEQAESVLMEDFAIVIP